MTAVLSIKGLSVRLPVGADRSHALHDVSFDMSPGEILCVVGESGSGKSMTAGAVLGLLPEGISADAGRIVFDGEDLLHAPERRMQAIRGARIGMIFQEPMSALNPLMTIGQQLAEVLRLHTGLGRAAIRARVLDLLANVGIHDPARAWRAYPHQLSGGQRQRAMIAMALALEPSVLIADEPTTALDVTTQARILHLISELQARNGMAVLFITHDFGVVAEIADRVVVMRQGKLVEQGLVAEVLNAPKHPYTQALIAAVPSLTPPPQNEISARDAVLTVGHVSKSYRARGILSRRRASHAVRDVSLVLQRGGTLGIVGESGSGKSTLARLIVRLLQPDEGSIIVDGTDIAGLSRRQMRERADRVQMVFQDPYGSLNPRRKAGDLVTQGPIFHGLPKDEALAKARELFALVGLPEQSFDRFPHEFSGGQRQRIGLARALAMRPQLLVADEPVSALDVSVQAQVLELLVSLKIRFGLSLLFITHDLRVAAQICDEIAVMKDGAVVEHASAASVFGNPQHDYTRSLLAAVPGRNWRKPAVAHHDKEGCLQ